MVLIYAILLPRYLKITGSPLVTVLLGGATYALMHIVEGWSLFDTPRDTALSLIFVMLTYLGPGMFKSCDFAHRQCYGCMRSPITRSRRTRSSTRH